MTEPLPLPRELAEISLTPEEARRLAAAGITSRELFWSRAGAAPGERLAPLAAETGIERERLVQILDALVQREEPRSGDGWLSRHWLDLVLLAGTVLVLGLGVRACATVREAARTPAAVTLARDVPALAVLRRKDLAVPAGADTLRGVQGVVGRVVLSPLTKGSPADPQRLGPRLAEGALGNRGIVTLTLGPRSGAAELPAGSRVELVLSPRTTPATAGAVVADVLVLAATRHDSSWAVVAAVPTGELPKLASTLGSSEVLVVRRPPPPLASSEPPVRSRTVPIRPSAPGLLPGDEPTPDY